jgi:hypothetical protein
VPLNPQIITASDSDPTEFRPYNYADTRRTDVPCITLSYPGPGLHDREPVTSRTMRGPTVAALVTCTLLAITGCANREETPTAATAAGAANVAGFDQGSAGACTIAADATRGQNGRDLDLATASQIITMGRTSRSTVITAATDVLSSAAAKAQAAAGNPDEAVLTAELSTAILKLQTVCQDADAVKAAITTPSTGGEGASAATTSPLDRKAN